MILRKLTTTLLLGLFVFSLLAQKRAQLDSIARPTPFQNFLTPSDTFNKKRFYVSVGAGVGLYGAFSVGLWQAWYKNTKLSPFHTFNDWNEWQQVDKMGHLYTAYNYSRWAYQGSRWTGMSRRPAAWTSAGVGLLLQTTTEVMDGYADKWGFSWGDMTFNVLGSGLFVAQELGWKEQRITLKVSSNPQHFPDILLRGVGHSGSISTHDRDIELYGKGFAERFIKDYNAQVNWFSINMHAFAPTSKIPPWLNLAVGYGAGNMLAGTGYDWVGKDGLTYSASPLDLPRYRQFFLSTDIELSRLPIKGRFWRMLIYGLHHIKLPGPALEYNTLGQLKFHWLYW
jgi:hypothetical protein